MGDTLDKDKDCNINDMSALTVEALNVLTRSPHCKGKILIINVIDPSHGYSNESEKAN